MKFKKWKILKDFRRLNFHRLNSISSAMKLMVCLEHFVERRLSFKTPIMITHNAPVVIYRLPVLNDAANGEPWITYDRNVTENDYRVLICGDNTVAQTNGKTARANRVELRGNFTTSTASMWISNTRTTRRSVHSHCHLARAELGFFWQSNWKLCCKRLFV